jgi:ABC-type sugar transport system permease subunit
MGREKSGTTLIGSLSDRIAPYVFIFPFIVFFIVLFLVPAAYSIFLSLHRYRGFGPMAFVGFRNYLNIFQYGVFWQAVRNTLFYLVFNAVPVIILSFLLALAVHGRSRPFQRIVKPLIFLPHIMAVMAATLTWRVIFSTNYGVINTVLGTSIPFLDSPHLMRWSVVILMVWRGFGWFFVVFLAGLTTVSDDVREAALMDGANSFQITFRIVIPIMKPIFLFTLLMETIRTLKIFTEPNILISGWLSGPVEVKPIMSIMVDYVRSGSFGRGAAAGWVIFAGILAVSLVQLKFLGRKD